MRRIDFFLLTGLYLFLITIPLTWGGEAVSVVLRNRKRKEAKCKITIIDRQEPKPIRFVHLLRRQESSRLWVCDNDQKEEVDAIFPKLVSIQFSDKKCEESVRRLSICKITSPKSWPLLELKEDFGHDTFTVVIYACYLIIPFFITILCCVISLCRCRCITLRTYRPIYKNTNIFGDKSSASLISIKGNGGNDQEAEEREILPQKILQLLTDPNNSASSRQSKRFHAVDPQSVYSSRDGSDDDVISLRSSTVWLANACEHEVQESVSRPNVSSTQGEKDLSQLHSRSDALLEKTNFIDFVMYVSPPSQDGSLDSLDGYVDPENSSTDDKTGLPDPQGSDDNLGFVHGLIDADASSRPHATSNIGELAQDLVFNENLSSNKVRASLIQISSTNNGGNGQVSLSRQDIAVENISPFIYTTADVHMDSTQPFAHRDHSEASSVQASEGDAEESNGSYNLAGEWDPGSKGDAQQLIDGRNDSENASANCLIKTPMLVNYGNGYELFYSQTAVEKVNSSSSGNPQVMNNGRILYDDTAFSSRNVSGRQNGKRHSSDGSSEESETSFSTASYSSGHSSSGSASSGFSEESDTSSNHPE